MLNRFAIVLGLLATILPAAAEDVWTLDASVRRALETAPEARVADAEIAERRGEYRQADAWPNPTVEISASNRLGLEDGSGGDDLTRTAITQPLSLTRLTRERRVADANLAAAESNRRTAQLEIEQRAALAFHALQLNHARLQLARERLDAARSYSARRRERLVRYLAPAERVRLEILHAEAEQAAASAEGEWSEALSRLRTLLALPPEVEPTAAPLTPAPAPAALETLLAGLDAHAAIVAARAERDAAAAGIDAARARRFSDPALTLFRERDFIGGQRRNVDGIGVSVQVPLWNTNDGSVAAAKARADATEAKREARQRALAADLRQSHTHLNHLLEQAGHFRTQMLEPARKLLDLSRRSFAAGETNVLALVDAHDGYFQAQGRYLELLAEGWREAATLRFAAGQSLLEDRP